MIALSTRCQGALRGAKIDVQGVTVPGKRCEFGDVIFTIDQKPANSLMEVVVTLFRPHDASECVARLEYFQHPSGFTSLFPFELKFACSAGGNAKPLHSIIFAVSIGMRATRECLELPLTAQCFESTQLLALLPAVQACSKFT